MKRFLLFVLILGIVCSLHGTTNCMAQIISKKTISLEMAKKIVNAAESESAKNKINSAIVILDDGGNMVYFEKMDNTQIGSIDVAIGKARTAIYFKRSTKIYEDQVSGGRNILLSVPNIVPVEGGLPLTADGQIIGSIGVSGGTPAQDGMAAKAGADFLLSQGGGNGGLLINNVRPEHIAMNVIAADSMTQWYIKNLGMKIKRESNIPNYAAFIADSGNHIMLEFYYGKSIPVLEISKLNPASFHLAFVVKDIKAVKEKLLSAKAALFEDIKKIPSGDQVLMLRDPWGMPIQFIERVKPMIAFSDLRPEHLAMNVSDSREKSKWYAANLDMKVMREGGAPTYGMFIGDAKENIMLELYQNSTVPNFEYQKFHPSTFHLAFMVDDIKAIKEKMISAGAKLIDDITKIPSGDQILMFRDKWGQPLQFVQRADPMLKEENK